MTFLNAWDVHCRTIGGAAAKDFMTSVDKVISHVYENWVLLMLLFSWCEYNLLMTGYQSKVIKSNHVIIIVIMFVGNSIRNACELLVVHK